MKCCKKRLITLYVHRIAGITLSMYTEYQEISRVNLVSTELDYTDKQC